VLLLALARSLVDCRIGIFLSVLPVIQLLQSQSVYSILKSKIRNRFRCEASVVAGRVGADVDHLHQSVQRPHFPGEVILLAVRWYLRYPLAYHHVSELLAEGGVSVDQSCIWH